MNSECEQFSGRKRDLCEGRGRDGRSNPRQSDSDRIRESIGLPPITVQEPQGTLIRERPKDSTKHIYSVDYLTSTTAKIDDD